MHSAVQIAEESRGEDGMSDAAAGPAAGWAPNADVRLLAFSPSGWPEGLPNIEEEPHRAES